uniref:FP protein C-terminal domain-containing protein n=1 Tax=Cacopsylla melanoneura TaxID=428564 RepID=A0A8D9FDQ1_9HEMI
MFNCRRCHEPIAADAGGHAMCSDCGQGFHFQCSITEVNWRKLGKNRDSWKCYECKNTKGSKDGNKDLNPLGNSDGNEDNNAKKNQAGLSPTTGNTPVTENSMREMFNEFSKTITVQIKEFEKSIQHSSDQMDTLLSRLDNMQEAFSHIQVKQQAMERENAVLKNTVDNLGRQMMEFEQKSFERNLELNGVPESVNEPKAIMETLCKKAKVDIPAENTYIMERAKTGPATKPKVVIIKFESKLVRDSILKGCKVSKPQVGDFTGNTAANAPVYVNEQLSPNYKKLFYQANQIKKEKNFAFLWLADNKILFKKTKEARTVRIYCTDDMK